MCGGDDKKKTTAPAATSTPVMPQAVQDAIRALEMGPTGYNEAMRINLGLDKQQGGARPQSGMTGGVPSFTGYTPVATTPDPLKPMLGTAPFPTPAATPAPAPVATPTPIVNPQKRVTNGSPFANRPRSND
ncbi:hypothetical protein J1C56_02125 [Aminobacter anthyllidis]|uniref:Uncharacterized protein n=1 Tax=Aminobacter anthyllidis TaxID=1035067 RepID=A0A9X1D1Y1_9HYPH|nr:hypothetical protein [Aminobacter anthyllidis]MBT1154382.1 hypothetical protein [Aminobacter anthyllidis]